MTAIGVGARTVSGASASRRRSRRGCTDRCARRATGRGPAPGSCSTACRRSRRCRSSRRRCRTCFARPKSISASEPSCAQHDVAGLQVAMQDADRMHDLQRAAICARYDSASPASMPLGDLRAQIAAREVFHRDVGMIVGDAEIEDAHDVRMTHLRDQLVLLQEARELHVLVAASRRRRAAPSARPSRRPARSRRDTPSTCRRSRARARSDGRESSPVRSATACSASGPVRSSASSWRRCTTASRSASAMTPMIDALAHQAVDRAALDDALRRAPDRRRARDT